MRSVLPKDVIVNVLAAEAAREFAVRPPAPIVRADVLQAEHGVRRDAAERRVIDLDRLELEPGDMPVRNVHSFRLRPSSLLETARNGGWSIEYFRLYEGPVQRLLRERIGLVGRPWSIVAAMTRVLTLGLLSANESGIIAVLSKNGIPGAGS